MKLSTKTKLLNFFRLIFLFSPLEKLLMQLNYGKEYGNFFSKFIPNHYQYKKNTLRFVERNNIKYCLDLSDLVDWFVYFGFKDHAKHRLFAMVNAGDCILDIGANVGEMSLNFAKKAGEQGKVFSFEPDSFNFKRLERNYKLNSFNNIELINKGLGNNPGKYVMRINENEAGNNGSKRIVGNAENAGNSIEAIEVIELDSFITNKNIKKINLIKMDVEGYEVNVLKSAEKTIEKFKPIIHSEMQDKKLREFGSSALEMSNFIKSKGYTLRNADSGELLDNSFDFTQCHIDVLCIPQ